MKVAVIGGGISGLAAAFRLQGRAEVVLLEASERLGGVIASRQRDGYLMEAGPDSILDKLGIRGVCRELGIEGDLITTNPKRRRSFIVRGRRLLPVPEGLYLMAPGSIRPFLRSPVVSPLGKLRMALDLALPRRPHVQDESLGSFVRRRLGREALERLAQPLAGGIYAADPERLGLAATLPQFLDMERQRGSVLRALLSRQAKPSPGVSGARYALFLSFRQGMQTLVEALSRHAGEVRLRTRVSACRPASASPPSTGWRLSTSDGPIEVDAVCLALPVWEARKLLAGDRQPADRLDPSPLGSLPAANLTLPCVEYSSSVTLNLGFRAEQIGRRLMGAGLVVPRVEGRTLAACTFSSEKFAGRAPAGHVLLRAFAGGMLNAEAVDMSDERLLAEVQRDLRDLLGVEGEPEVQWVNRWHRTMPQYEVGHLERLDRLERELARLPGLALAGNGYRGVGVPDCLASGFSAADRLLGASPAP